MNRKKQALWLLAILVGIVGSMKYYFYTMSRHPIFLSEPLVFDNFTVQGEIIHRHLQSLTFEPKKSPSTKINSCYDDKMHGLPIRTPHELKYAQHDNYFCAKLALLQKARAAKDTYLQHFSLNQTHYLPATLVASWETSDRALDNLSLKDAIRAKEVKIVIRTPHAVTYVYHGVQTTLTEIARGDFNDDGIQDLAIELSVSPHANTPRTDSLFILTRHNAHSQLDTVVMMI